MTDPFCKINLNGYLQNKYKNNYKILQKHIDKTKVRNCIKDQIFSH